MNGTDNSSHIISVLVENRFGVLARISGLFSARGYNIQSLSVGPTDDPTVSRITLVVGGDEQILDQIKKQLNKLIDTIKVVDLTTQPHLERELALIKVRAPYESRSEIMQIVDIFRAKIIDVGREAVTIEMTGDDGKIQAMLNLLNEFGIIELARSGKVALSRGAKPAAKVPPLPESLERVRN